MNIDKIMRTIILALAATFIMTRFAFADGGVVNSLNRLGVDQRGTVYAVANHDFDNLCGDNGREVQIYLPQNFPNHDAALSILMGAYLSREPIWFSLEDDGSKCKIKALNLDNR